MEIVGPLLDRVVSPGTRNAPTLPSFPLLPPPFHLFHPHPTPSPSPALPSIHVPHNPHLLYSISPAPMHLFHLSTPLYWVPHQPQWQDCWERKAVLCPHLGIPDCPQGQSSSCSEMGTVESSGPVWPLQSTAPVRGPPHLCGYPRKSGLELALPTVCSSIPHTPSQAASPSMASSCLAPGCLPGARSHPRRTLLP